MKKAKLLLPVLAAAGAYAVGSQALFSVASRRDSLWLRLPKKEKTDEYESLVSSFRARMAEKEMTDLTIYSRDGLKLTAHWYPAQDAKRTIVLVHGWRSAWYRDFAGIAEDLHDGGANLLFIEQRAHGASEGEYISYGLMERYDVADWACRAAEFAGSALPMYLFGVSMGASTVMMASALPLPDCVRGVCADCGYTSPGEIIRRTSAEQTHLPCLEPGANFCMRLRTGLDYDGYSTVDALRASRLPTLFVHGDADGFVPVSMSYENYAACASPKRLLVVHGAGHGVSYLVDPESYRQNLAALFDFCEGRSDAFGNV